MIVALLLWKTLTLADPAPPATPFAGPARERFDRGLDHYNHQRFPEAIEELRAAFAIDPRPEILFAWAQAERLRGDCGAASSLYRDLLRRELAAAARRAAEEGLHRCEEAWRQRGQPVPEQASPPELPPTLVAAPPPAPAPAAPPPPAAPAPARGPDWIAIGLGSAGVIAGGVGAYLVHRSGQDADAAGRATTYDQFMRDLDRADTLRGVAIGTLVAGGALLGAAAIHYVLVRPSSPADTRASLELRPTGIGLRVAY